MILLTEIIIKLVLEKRGNIIAYFKLSKLMETINHGLFGSREEEQRRYLNLGLKNYSNGVISATNRLIEDQMVVLAREIGTS